MPGLAELQAGLAAALAGGDAALPDGWLAPGAAVQLDIHRNHRTASLRAALAATFPVVGRLVGTAFFARLAADFVAAHPPGSPILAAYGAALPEFIEGYAPAAALPYLPDMARLEWLLNAAYHSAPAPALERHALAGLPEAALSALGFELQPGLAYLDSRHEIDRIWRANQAAGEGRVTLGRAGARLEIRRLGADSAFAALTPGAFAFRRSLHAGAGLATAMGEGMAAEGGFDPGGALAGLFDDGLVVRLLPGGRAESG